MSSLGLSLRQVRYTNTAFWRNPASAFFTFVFPLMFLVIFTALLGSGEVDFGHGLVLDQATYFVAAMAAFGVITATYTNNAISVTFQRDQGILKRLRGTPLPVVGVPVGARAALDAGGADPGRHHAGVRQGRVRDGPADRPADPGVPRRP